MIRKIPNETKHFHFFNANPKNNRTDDCVIRAIATATGKSWDEVLLDLTAFAQKYKLMPNDKKCYGKYLESLGWNKNKQPRKDNNTKYTGKEFCEILDSLDRESILDYKGSANCVLAHIGGCHIVCIKPYNNKYKVFDIWDSTRGSIGNFWTKG